VVLNCDLIEHMETTPDTVITLTTGQKLMVLESAEEIIRRVVEFRRAIFSGLPGMNMTPDHRGEAEKPSPDRTGDHGRS
jgi:flagellar protein FlbD